MKNLTFKIYSEYGALNSVPVFKAVSEGLSAVGGKIVDRDEDISVIWSVLWAGRMLGNKTIFETAKASGKRVLIIEVGTLIRNKTWRVSFDHINRQGFFGNLINLDPLRPKKLGVSLQTPPSVLRPEILIACQHEKSHQWNNQPSTANWVQQQIEKIRKYSDRNIVVRPHPRSAIRGLLDNCKYEQPKLIKHTYDEFDLNMNYHCIINHNSGVGVQAGLASVPLLVDTTSLAFDISESYDTIENPVLTDRREWFLKICHTEWLLEEIQTGLPFKRLLVDFL
jgi:hypothetical protein